MPDDTRHTPAALAAAEAIYAHPGPRWADPRPSAAELIDAALADERAATANVVEAAQELLLFLNDQPSELAQDILTGNLSDMLHRAAISKAEGTLYA